LSERGSQLANPFHSVWSPSDGHPFLAWFFIILGCASISLYMAFLGFKIFRVWTCIRAKREAQLYRMSELRRLKVENVIFRFKFLMLLSLGCAACTFIIFLYLNFIYYLLPIKMEIFGKMIF
jgi:hypothetical protein